MLGTRCPTVMTSQWFRFIRTEFQVLKCLSELSKTQAVRARGFPMFPKAPPANVVEYCNVEAFKNLEDFAA